MLQDFLNWIKIKFQIHEHEKRPLYFNEREIWWCQFGQNIGNEQNGKGQNFMRPVLVIKKYNRNICLVVPLSSQIKENKYYFILTIKQKTQAFLISQMRTLDTKRFVKKMSDLIVLSDLKNIALLLEPSCCIQLTFERCDQFPSFDWDVLCVK